MKVTVVGGASTYTPELVDGIARLRDVLPVDDAGAGRPGRRAARASSAGMARRMLARAGPPRDGRDDDRHRRRGHRRRRRAAAAARRRAGRPHAGRDLAARVRLHRAGDDGRRRPGQGAAHRAGRARHRREGARALGRPDAWIVDFTNPVGIVTRALLNDGPPRGRPVQRGDRLPALVRRAARRHPDEVTLDHVGLNHLTWERSVTVGGRDVLPELVEKHAAEIAERVEQPEWLIRQLGVVPSYYLRLLLQPRPRGRRGPRRPVAGERGRGDRGGAARPCTPTRRVDDEAGAARPARRCVLLRGGDRPARLADRRPWRRAGGQPAQRRHAALPARRRRRRGAGDDHGRRGDRGARRRRSADLLGPDQPHLRLRAAGPRRRGPRWPRPRLRGAARPPAGGSGATRPRSSPTCSWPPTGSTSAGRSDPPRGRGARPRHRRREQQDRRRPRERRRGRY